METETNKFLKYREGRNVFAFCCPVCGAAGELGVPAEGNRNALVECITRCGAQYIVRYPRNLAGKPSLEFCFGPRRKPARPAVQAKKKKRRVS